MKVENQVSRLLFFVIEEFSMAVRMLIANYGIKLWTNKASSQA
jgi:hypothetical protein